MFLLTSSMTCLLGLAAFLALRLDGMRLGICSSSVAVSSVAMADLAKSEHGGRASARVIYVVVPTVGVCVDCTYAIVRPLGEPDKDHECGANDATIDVTGSGPSSGQCQGPGCAVTSNCKYVASVSISKGDCTEFWVTGTEYPESPEHITGDQGPFSVDLTTPCENGQGTKEGSQTWKVEVFTDALLTTRVMHWSIKLNCDRCDN